MCDTGRGQSVAAPRRTFRRRKAESGASHSYDVQRVAHRASQGYDEVFLPGHTMTSLPQPVRASCHRRVFSALLVVLVPTLLQAQPPVTKDRRLPPPGFTECDKRERLLDITLLDDATGAPVNEATVTLVRRDGGDTLQVGRRLARDGAWVFMDYGELTREQVRPGIPVVLVVQRTGRPDVRRPLTLGLDPRGCHLELRGAASLRI